MCNGKCVMCGMCCKAIWVGYPPDYIQGYANRALALYGVKGFEVLSHTNNLIFMYMHWTPICMEEAINVNPWIKTWADGKFIKAPEKYTGHFYKCDCFNKETNLCTVHNGGQPEVCTGYPGYGNKVTHQKYFYSKECGYAPWNIKK